MHLRVSELHDGSQLSQLWSEGTWWTPAAMDRDAEIRPISDVEEGAAPAGEKKGENKGTAHRHT